jgi:hypothetical protein
LWRRNKDLQSDGAAHSSVMQIGNIGAFGALQ